VEIGNRAIAIDRVENARVSPKGRHDPMKQDVRFCTTSDGVRIAYAIAGNGPPLLMPATWLSHLEHQWKSLAWNPWLDALTQNYSLIRYDSRGCGLSDRDSRLLSFEGWMHDIAAVADAAGFARFDLLGVCWGSPIAIAYAASNPERVRRLVLYGGYAEGRLRGARRMDADQARILLDMTRLGWGQSAHAFCRVWGSFFQPGGTLAHYRSWSEQQALSTSPETAAQLLEIGWKTDVRDAARQVKCPTLALHLDRDEVVPIEVGREMACLIPDCRFVQLDGENHMPLATDTAWPRIVAEIDAFLKPTEQDPAQSGIVLPLDELTARERDVLEAIARGLDNGEIAAALGMSEKTVRNHVTRLLDKIGAEHRYQAIVRAREAGFGLKSPAAAP
jgi:pimeloyl-ACP methyl ester carboxylesterase/DNA-binding CsgD family transcriptional regulator